MNDVSGLKVNVPPLFPIECLFVYLFIYGVLCLAKKSLRRVMPCTLVISYVIK